MLSVHLLGETKLVSGKPLRKEPSLLALEFRELAGVEKG